MAAFGQPLVCGNLLCYYLLYFLTFELFSFRYAIQSIFHI